MGKLRNYFLNHYPRTDFHELNQDWMITMLYDMINQVENFVEINAIKYANPIQWSITRQYEKNTIVITPDTGTAYITVKPVPAGINITRTEYWTKVFDLSPFLEGGLSNFAVNFEKDFTLQATKHSDIGDWVVWNSKLYRAIDDINVGDLYVVDVNLERMTVEQFVKEIDTKFTLAISNEATARSNADTSLHNEIVAESVARDNAIADEADAREAADDSIIADLNDEITARENADTTLSNAINNEVTARETAIANEASARQSAIAAEIATREAADLAIISSMDAYQRQYVIVTDHGVSNDGTGNVASAFAQVVTDYPNRTYFFPDGTYNFGGTQIEGNIHIIGSGNAIIKNFYWHGTSAESVTQGQPINGSQFYVENVIFDSSTSDYGLKVDSVQQIEFIRDTRIKNCKFYGENALEIYYTLSVYVQNCSFMKNGTSIHCVSSTNLFFDSCYFLSPSVGVNIEPISQDEARMGGETFNFSNCFWYNGITGIKAKFASNIQLVNCIMDYFTCCIHLVGSRECKLTSCYFGFSDQGYKNATNWSYYIAPPRKTALYAEKWSTLDWWSSVNAINTQFVAYGSVTDSPVVFDGGGGGGNYGVHDSSLINCKLENYSDHVNTLFYARRCDGLKFYENTIVSVEHPVSYSYNIENTCLHVSNYNNNFSACTYQGQSKAPNKGNTIYGYVESHQVTFTGNGTTYTPNQTVTFNNKYDGGVPRIFMQISGNSAGVQRELLVPVLSTISSTDASIKVYYPSSLASGATATVDILVMRDISTFN